jgi:hypothetical protein
MEQVKLIRLKTGEDIISYIETYEAGTVILRSPMIVIVKMNMRTENQTVLMDHWLPITVIKENEAIINASEILTMVDPSAEFSEYYVNAVITLDEIKQSESSPNGSSSLEDEFNKDLDINHIMESIGLDGSKTIH